MTLDKGHKDKIIADYRINEKDTGSANVQIAICTARIDELTEHMKAHKKDVHSQHGLLKIVSRRRKLLEYIKSRSYDQYKKLTASLNIRK